jgi:hypothetical protein
MLTEFIWLMIWIQEQIFMNVRHRGNFVTNRKTISSSVTMVFGGTVVRLQNMKIGKKERH